MRFIIPVNEPDTVTGSVTYKRIDVGDVCLRVAKRKLRLVLAAWGMEQRHMKKFINELRQV